MNRLRPTSLRLEILVLPLALAATVLAARQSVAAPQLVVVAAAALLFVVLSTWSLIAGLAVFTLVTFPEVLPSFAGVGTLAKPAGLVLAFAWVLVVISRHDQVPFLPREWPAVALLAGCFLVWAAASMLWAADQQAATTTLTRLVQVAVLFAIAYTALRSPRDMRALAWAFLLGAFATAVYSLATDSYSEAGRLAGIFDSNYFAAQLVAAAALGSFMLPAARGGGARLLLITMLITYSVAFALTQSRGGLVALGAAMIAAVVYAGRYRREAVVVVLALTGAGVVYYGSIAAIEVRERITNFSAEGSAGRADEWRIAAEMIDDHPIIGVGLGNFSVVEPEYALRDVNLLRPEYILENRLEAHNTYLEVASELGLVGLGLFAALVCASLVAAVRGVRRLEQSGDDGTEALARGFVIATVSLLVAYIFLSALFEKQLWLLLGALLAIHFVAHRREPAPEASAASHRAPDAPVRYRGPRLAAE